ncbi:BTF domain [Cryptosporidium xiaoi]|uniref:Nascent polypeptide-associated complex subunit beta n=1 Tax=Cryptosporidium xiaoi TaxID=659607 RepID=A0AAV9XTT0_9CRYT|nr:BTF domain [Cryptosporidium bovis]
MNSEAPTNDSIEQARQRLRDKFGLATQVGGKGTARRKKRAQKQSLGADAKKIQAVTSRFRCQLFPAIGEVMMMRNNGTCLYFSNPRLQASVASNTYILSGNPQEKLTKDLPQHFNPVDLSAFLNDPKFQKLLEESQANQEASEDDDIPDLVENFEEVEEKKVTDE